MNDLISDYFESLTSFHKPIWIRKHEISTKFHVDESTQIDTDIPFNLKYLKIYDQSDMMEVDEEFSFDRYEIVDENEQIDIDTTFNLKDLRTNDQSDMMEIDEQSSSENYEIIDSKSRKILNHFLSALNFDNIIETNQISSQAQIINDLIENSPFITVHNKDRSVRLKSKTVLGCRDDLMFLFFVSFLFCSRVWMFPCFSSFFLSFLSVLFYVYGIFHIRSFCWIFPCFVHSFWC